MGVIYLLNIILKSNNSSLLLTLLLGVGLPLLIAFLSSRHFKEAVFRHVKVSTIAFLALSFPLLEYYSIWYGWSFWPEGFYHNLSIIDLDNPLQEPTGVHYVFYVLSVITSFLTYYSFFCFTFGVIQLSKSRRWQMLYYLPLVNIIVLVKDLKGILVGKNYIYITFLWAFISMLWLYYRVFAVPIGCFLGIDSFSFFDSALFGERPKDVSLNSDVLFFQDIVAVITPPMLYLAAILGLFLTKRLSLIVEKIS